MGIRRSEAAGSEDERRTTCSDSGIRPRKWALGAKAVVQRTRSPAGRHGNLDVVPRHAIHIVGIRERTRGPGIARGGRPVENRGVRRTEEPNEGRGTREHEPQKDARRRGGKHQREIHYGLTGGIGGGGGEAEEWEEAPVRCRNC